MKDKLKKLFYWLIAHLLLLLSALGLYKLLKPNEDTQINTEETENTIKENKEKVKKITSVKNQMESIDKEVDEEIFS